MGSAVHDCGWGGVGACRALFTCCQLGLWGTAHADGTIVMRLLPTGARAERQTVQVEPNAPVMALNVPEFRAPFLARAPSLVWLPPLGLPDQVLLMYSCM